MCENNHATRSLLKIWHLGRADLDKKSAQTWCDLHPAGRISEREEADWNHNQSYTPNHWPLWSMENLELYLMVILVAANGHWHRSFLQIMRKVSDQQNWHAETTRVSTQLAYPNKPWQLVGMDFMGPLPRSLGNDYLLVIIDQLMSQVHLVPTMTRVTAREVAWLFLKEVVRLHGVPKSIVSDRDTKFTSTFWHELHRLMGTKLLMSTVFHPQMDGTTEWANCSIG